jgi:hypothetical protein
MNHADRMSADKPEGEHPEKSEISSNLMIVVAPEGPHTIRYVSMDWSRPFVPLMRHASSPGSVAIWR